MFFVLVRLVLIGYAHLTCRTCSFPDAWNRWDATHYLDIATKGYHAKPLLLVFFPFYPFVIRYFLWTGIPAGWLAVLISNTASVGAAYLLYRLTQLEYGQEAAGRAVWYLAVFPTAYFLSAGYSESLFLLTAIACVYAARRRRWGWAWVFGVLAATTRFVGIALAPALLLEAIQQRREGRPWRWRVLAAASGPLAGLAIYGWCNYAVMGSWAWFFTPLRDHWYKAFQWPWVGWYHAFRRPDVLNPEVWSAGLGFLVLPVIAVRFRWVYVMYYAVSFGIMTSTSFWLSLPRYTLTQFPLFLLFAGWGQHPGVNRALSVICVFFLEQFMAAFIRGQWAF